MSYPYIILHVASCAACKLYHCMYGLSSIHIDDIMQQVACTFCYGPELFPACCTDTDPIGNPRIEYPAQVRPALTHLQLASMSKFQFVLVFPFKLFVFAGLGNPRSGLHPVQARLAKAHGSQCGFCTPGFVMSMYSLLRSKPEAPTETEIEDNLAGNLWYDRT